VSLELKSEAERLDELLAPQPDQFDTPLAQLRPVGTLWDSFDEVVGGKERHIAEAARLCGEICGEEPDGGMVVGLIESQGGDPADLFRVALRVNRGFFAGRAAHRSPLAVRGGPEDDDNERARLVALTALPKVADIALGRPRR
jgi:hypothetical protein